MPPWFRDVIVVGAMCLSVACDVPVGHPEACVFEGCLDPRPPAPAAPSMCSMTWTSEADLATGEGENVVVDAVQGALRAQGGRGTWRSAPFALCSGTGDILVASARGALPRGAGRALQVRTADTVEALSAAPWRAVEAQTGLSPAGPIDAAWGQVEVSLTPADDGAAPAIHRIDLCVGRGAGLVRVPASSAANGIPLHALVHGGPCGAARAGTDGVVRVPMPPGPASLTVEAERFRPVALAVEATPGRQVDVPVVLPPAGLWEEPRGSGRNQARTGLTAGMDAPPGLRWATSLGAGNVPLQVVLADLDGDTTSEVLVPTGERLEARRGDGTLLWRSSGGAGDEIGLVLAVADLDADGEVEVVCGNAASAGTAGKMRVGRLIVLSGRSGRVRFEHSLFDVYQGFGTVSHLRHQNTQVADLDGDPGLEVAISAEYSHEVRVLDFSDGVEQGALRWIGTWSGYKNYRRIAVGDIDADGFAETIVGTSGQFVALDGRDGTPRYSPRWSDTAVYGAFFLRDIGGDARPEILLLGQSPRRLMAFGVAPDGSLVTLHDTPLVSTPFPVREVLGDVDADGRNELVFQSGNQILVHDAASGAQEAALRGALRAFHDFDGDGRPEILSDTGGGLELFAADGLGGLVARWRQPGLGHVNVTNPWKEKYTRIFMNDARPDPTMFRDYPQDEEVVAGGMIYTRDRARPAVVALDARGVAPVERWRAEVEPGVIFGVIGRADVTGDAGLEVVVAMGDGTLLVLDEATGATLARFPVSPRLATPLVTDLDDDGRAEVLLAGRNTAQGSPDIGPIELLRADTGEPLPFAHGADIWWGHGTQPAVEALGSARGLLVRSGRRAVTALSTDGLVRWTRADFADDVTFLGAAPLAGDGSTHAYVHAEDGALQVLTATRAPPSGAARGPRGSCRRRPISTPTG